MFDNIVAKLALRRRYVTFHISANKTEAESFRPHRIQQYINNKLHGSYGMSLVFLLKCHKFNLIEKIVCL